MAKDIGMANLFYKSSFYRTAILLWLFVTLAGQMLGVPLIISAAAASSPSGATSAAMVYKQIQAFALRDRTRDPPHHFRQNRKVTS